MENSIKQLYHPYHLWEDYHAGMWRKVPSDEEKEYLIKAIEFTGNAELYGSWMLKVIAHWPIACEHNLTNLNTNRKAWIGQAAVLMAINCPEYITRYAWMKLTKQQQDEANQKAKEAIELWERNHLIKAS